MSFNTRLIVFLLLTQFLIYGQVEINNCPTGCRVCNSRSADCSSSQLSIVPKGISPKVDTINLSANKITILDETSFEKMDVLTLIIGLNEIETIGANTFVPLKSLVTLDLARNKIYSIDTKGFSKLINLRTLSLASNHLTSLNNIFDELSMVSSINIAHNRLVSIGENDFAHNVHLRMLDLSHNNISSIHRDAFFTLKRLRYLILASNPLITINEFNMGKSMLQLLDLTQCMLINIPLGIPGSVSDMRLVNNALQEFNRTQFENATGLRLIALDNNKIERIEDGTFNNSKSLEAIWMNNNNMKYIPKQLPNNLKALHMNSNRIVSITNDTFNKNSTIEHISVQSNSISTIHPNAFSGLQNLSKVNMHNNKVKILTTNTFVNLPSVQSISLSNNPLKHIKWNAFKNLPSLENISFSHDTQPAVKISYNLLNQIPNIKAIKIISSPGMARAFLMTMRRYKKPIMKGTKYIDLKYNELKSIPRALRRKFPNLNTFLIEGNIFTCDRKLLWLKRWLKNKKPKIISYKSEEPQCFMPEANRGQSIIRLADRIFLRNTKKKANSKPKGKLQTKPKNNAAKKGQKKVKATTVRYRKKRKKTMGVRTPRTGRVRKTRKKNRKQHVQPKKTSATKSRSG